MNTPARTRFAPSPTGYVHVGGIRTAVFAWLIARQTGGQFILRIEDTDKNREVEGSENHIIESLKALGLQYDEGPDIGGDYGPYRQSDRLDHYKEWAKKLIASGRAYADPYTAEEVQAFREQAQKDKKPFLYRNHRPENTPEWDGSTPLRFKSEPQAYEWHDEIMGDMHAGAEAIDDFILIKSDGYPTYNFAHIIDDLEMKVTHVIRGQEFLASMPNYLNLYEALGIDKPVFATAPPVLGPDGNKKLSKRDNAKDVLDYIKDGFMPEALVNFITSLGWNDGTEQEEFTMEELTEKFSLNRVQKSGARFDERRLLWMNGAYLRNMSVDEISELCKDFWPDEANDYPDDYKKQVAGLVQERIKYLAELPELTMFFFKDLPVNPELIDGHKQLKKMDKPEVKTLLEEAMKTLSESDFTEADITERLNNLLEQTGQKPAVLFSLVRISTTQAPASPQLSGTLAVLGKERSLKRLQVQIDSL